jgi:hypothetical protein
MTTKHFGEGKGSFTLPLPPLAPETPAKLVAWLNHSKKKDRDELRSLWNEVNSYLLNFIDSWRDHKLRKIGRRDVRTALNMLMQLWGAGKLDALRLCDNCKRSCFIARKSNDKYCSRECLRAKISASYDTDEYRKRKRLAMSRARAARKAMLKAAQAYARRRNS